MERVWHASCARGTTPVGYLEVERKVVVPGCGKPSGLPAIQEFAGSQDGSPQPKGQGDRIRGSYLFFPAFKPFSITDFGEKPFPVFIGDGVIDMSGFQKKAVVPEDGCQEVVSHGTVGRDALKLQYDGTRLIGSHGNPQGGRLALILQHDQGSFIPEPGGNSPHGQRDIRGCHTQDYIPAESEIRGKPRKFSHGRRIGGGEGRELLGRALLTHFETGPRFLPRKDPFNYRLRWGPAGSFVSSGDARSADRFGGVDTSRTAVVPRRAERRANVRISSRRRVRAVPQADL